MLPLHTIRVPHPHPTELVDMPPEFSLEFTAIPLARIRGDFEFWRRNVRSPEFREHFNGGVSPIRGRQLTWVGPPGEFLTYLLQRLLIGVESYVCGAVGEQLDGGRRKSVWWRYTGLQGESWAADLYYNALPARVRVDLPMRYGDQPLWSRTLAFYREVRDPAFQGGQLSARDLGGVLEAVDFIGEIYAWIDRWHVLERPAGWIE